MKHNKRNEAVSPVVGVMLMLVITIIIAAVAGTFVSGISSGATVAPSAAFDAKIISTGGDNHDQYVLTIEHKGGDALPTKDLKIQTYTTLTDGTVKSGTVTSKSKPIAIFKELGDPETKVKIPYLADAAKGLPGSPNLDFGNFTLVTGNVMSSGTTAGTCGNIKDSYGTLTTPTLLGFNATNVGALFGPGCEVEVKIIHTPSDKIIFSKKVIVQ